MKLTTKTFKTAIFTFQLLHVLLACYVVYKLHTSLVNSLILLFALIFVVVYDPLLKPLVIHKEKTIEKEQKVINKHMKIAKKQGKKPFPKGKPNKIHTVWANNSFEADKLYNLHIAPKIIKHPTTPFYYISKSCNNTKNN